MFPIALSLDGITELLIVVITMIGLNVYEDYYGWEVIDGDVMIRIHEPFVPDTYYCPFYCEVDHPHKAHTPKSCNNCTHYIYNIVK